MSRTGCLGAGLLGVALACGPVACEASAGQPPVAEYAVKAACLLNFLMFVEPAGGASTASTERIIVILGKDPFGSNFLEVEGRPVGDDGRTLRIVRLSSFKKAYKPVLRQCDMLFVAASEKRRFAEILEATKGAPVLTVSDEDGFMDAGGMMELIVVEDRVRWEINRAAITAGGLVASSQLYRSALRVTGASL